MCGVEDLSVRLRQRRLRCIVLGEVGEMRVGGRQPAGKPRKNCRECVMEDMMLLGVEDHVAQDQQKCKSVVAYQTQLRWKNTGLNTNEDGHENDN